MAISYIFAIIFESVPVIYLADSSQEPFIEFQAQKIFT